MGSRTWKYGVVGGALALGAPVGWFVLRVVLGLRSWTDELSAQADLYLYLLVATVIAFTTFGLLTGHVVEGLAKRNLRLSDLALTDAMTGLRNARYFHERLQEENARAVRLGTSLALIVGDLDHFKRVNDEHGHAAGDRVLETIGRIISRAVRAGDTACRIGGEEFAVVCPNTDRREAVQIAERIRTAVGAESTSVAGSAISITMSLGVAVKRRDQDLGELFTAADGALYEGKKAGRNRVVAADPPAAKPEPAELAPSSSRAAKLARLE